MIQDKNGEQASTSHDATREKIVRKVTWVGLVVNLFLAAIKFIAGIYGRSQALVADAIHSLTDLTTDIAVIAGSHYWSRPPDENHPYGHRRLETLVTVFIGIALIAAGIGIGWKAISALQEKHVAPPKWIAVFAALVSIGCKESLYRWTAITGRRVKSAALAANAWHHRTDAISSIPVLIAVAGARIAPAWSFLDKVGAKGLSIGDAAVYASHANFIINKGAATAWEVRLLASELKRRVLEEYGIMLEEEVIYLPEFGSIP